MLPALEASRPLRFADLQYRAAEAWSQVRLVQEEASSHNLLTTDGRRAFASRMRSHQFAREQQEREDEQEML